MLKKSNKIIIKKSQSYIKCRVIKKTKTTITIKEYFFKHQMIAVCRLIKFQVNKNCIIPIKITCKCLPIILEANLKWFYKMVSSRFQIWCQEWILILVKLVIIFKQTFIEKAKIFQSISTILILQTFRLKN